MSCKAAALARPRRLAASGRFQQPCVVFADCCFCRATAESAGRGARPRQPLCVLCRRSEHTNLSKHHAASAVRCWLPRGATDGRPRVLVGESGDFRTHGRIQQSDGGYAADPPRLAHLVRQLRETASLEMPRTGRPTDGCLAARCPGRRARRRAALTPGRGPPKAPAEATAPPGHETQLPRTACSMCARSARPARVLIVSASTPGHHLAETCSPCRCA